MIVIGLTGGIGSGKSSAANAFRQLGIVVVDADQKSRDVVEPGQPALTAISNKFGEEILLRDGSLNRAKLRSIIFRSEEDRLWLESLLHPLIRDAIKTDLDNADSPYAILESPLLFETDQHTMTDYSLLVDVPVATQIERTCRRDNNDEAQVQRIIEAQMPREQKQANANYILDNDSTLEALREQVLSFHQTFLSLPDTQ